MELNKKSVKEKINTIICPYCKREEIPFDEALTHQVKEQLQKEFNEKLARKEQELKSKEEAVTKKEKQIEKLKKEQEKEIEKIQKMLQRDFFGQLQYEKKKIEESIKKKLSEEVEMEIKNLQRELEKKREKLEMLYEYLSGKGFHQQKEGIVDAFVSMNQDIDAEKRAMEKIWSKREKQIEKVVKNTGRLYGSLEVIARSTLPELKVLELKVLKGE